MIKEDHRLEPSRMQKKKCSMRQRLVISSLVLFIVGLGFNAFFTFTSLEKLYLESIVSQYRVFGKDLQRNLENGLRYGKTLQNFIGVEKLLTETNRNISKKITGEEGGSGTQGMKFRETDISVYVALPDGKILYSGNDNSTMRKLPVSARVNQEDLRKTKDPSSASNYIKHQDTYITNLHLRDKHKNVVGTVAISFKEKQIKAFLEDINKANMQSIIIISACGIFLLITLLHFLIPTDADIQKFSKRKISLVIFLIISSAQILTCGLSTNTFKNHFLKINKENTKVTNALLKRDVEYLLNKGVRIDRLWKMDVYLKEIIVSSPELKDITLFEHTDQPLYRATKERVTDFQKSEDAYPEWVVATKFVPNPEYNYRIDLAEGEKFKGYFSTNTSKAILFDKLIDTVADSLTLVVVSILFFVELLILIFKYIEREGHGSQHPMAIHYGVMRPAAFIFLFGIDLSISFLPLHMETLYVPIYGLAKYTVTGLPISMEFLFVGISILISGVWLDRRGWHEPFLTGLVLAGSGILYSWLAPDAVHFIISRGIVGLGYGLSLMASQGFVINFSDWGNKTQGLAHLFAGIYAGSICGGATGAMLAEWMGYKPVFLIGALIVFSVIGYTIISMRNGMIKPEVPAAQKAIGPPKRGRVFGFLTNRTVLGLIFFSSMPAAIAVIGFLYYFSPIYLNQIGASQSTIGQILMIYGICLIYFGPFLSRYVDASQQKRIYVFLGCILGSFAFLTFQVLEGIAAAVTAVFLLGLSSSFVLAAQSAYALELKVTQQLGEGKAIGIFRSTSRIGQMLGPIVFSSVIVAMNTYKGLTFLGVAYLLAALLFFLMTQKDYRKDYRKVVALENV
jgi:predicted MFS family arabinose efflux permease